MSTAPSENSGNLDGGVVRPFSVERRSPNILYVGDRIGSLTVLGFQYVSPSFMMVEISGSIWPESLISFRSLIEHGNRTD